MRFCMIIPPALYLADPEANVPLGPLYVAAYAQKSGYEVSVISLAGVKSSGWRLPEAEVYGISITTPQFSVSRQLAANIKKEFGPDRYVVAGGPHPTVLPQETISCAEFDSVVVGEGEKAIVDVMKDAVSGGLKKIYMGEPIQKLDEIPFPPRNLLPINCIRTFEIMKHKYKPGGTTCIIGSRGCPFNCAFCPNILSRKVRFRSAENIVDEMNQVIDEYGIYQFKFQDDCFTLNRKLVFDLCDRFRSMDVALRIITRANLVNDALAEKLYYGGCRDVSLGTESGSNKILKMVNKGMTVEENEHAYRTLKKAGLTTICNLIFGLPGEDEKTVEETISFLRRNRKYIDVVNMATLVPYPRTAIWDNPDSFNMEIMNRNFHEYHFFHFKDDMLLTRNKEVPLEKMEMLKRKMYDEVTILGFTKKEWEKDTRNTLSN